jgi:hypothetical protein
MDQNVNMPGSSDRLFYGFPHRNGVIDIQAQDLKRKSLTGLPQRLSFF